MVTSVDVVGDIGGDSVGAKRVLNGFFRETLRVVDAANRTFEYSIDDGPGAVSKHNVRGYIGRARILPVTDDGHTFVEWSSRWTAGGEGAKEFCDPIYHALLG